MDRESVIGELLKIAVGAIPWPEKKSLNPVIKRHGFKDMVQPSSAFSEVKKSVIPVQKDPMVGYKPKAAKAVKEFSKVHGAGRLGKILGAAGALVGIPAVAMYAMKGLNPADIPASSGMYMPSGSKPESGGISAKPAIKNLAVKRLAGLGKESSVRTLVKLGILGTNLSGGFSETTGNLSKFMRPGTSQIGKMPGIMRATSHTNTPLGRLDKIIKQPMNTASMPKSVRNPGETTQPPVKPPAGMKQEGGVPGVM